MRWFKMSTAILYSSINYELSLEEQAAFMKLLALCAELGGSGVIADGEGQSMPHGFIASRIHVPEEILDSMLEKCQKTNRIYENSNGITISKWKEYQSEYQRQKPYRQRAAINDPEKYKNQGQFDDIVVRTPKDLKRIKKQRAAGK